MTAVAMQPAQPHADTVAGPVLIQSQHRWPGPCLPPDGVRLGVLGKFHFSGPWFPTGDHSARVQGREGRRRWSGGGTGGTLWGGGAVHGLGCCLALQSAAV